MRLICSCIVRSIVFHPLGSYSNFLQIHFGAVRGEVTKSGEKIIICN